MCPTENLSIGAGEKKRGSAPTVTLLETLSCDGNVLYVVGARRKNAAIYHTQSIKANTFEAPAQLPNPKQNRYPTMLFTCGFSSRIQFINENRLTQVLNIRYNNDGS